MHPFHHYSNKDSGERLRLIDYEKYYVLEKEIASYVYLQIFSNFASLLLIIKSCIMNFSSIPIGQYCHTFYNIFCGLTVRVIKQKKSSSKISYLHL